MNGGCCAGKGWDVIQEQIKKLEKRHAAHIAAYGEGNERRLTGGFCSRQLAGHKVNCCLHIVLKPFSVHVAVDGAASASVMLTFVIGAWAQASTRRAAWRTSAGAWPTAAPPSASAAPCPSTSAATTRTAAQPPTWCVGLPALSLISVLPMAVAVASPCRC
jgi:hypothetical protein